MAKNSITPEQVQACYLLGKKCFDKEMTVKDAVEELWMRRKMDPGSAKMHIDFFLHMFMPKQFKRCVKQAQLECYLEGVLCDYGADHLKIFLKGLEYHIQYRMSIGKTVPGYKQAHNEFSRKVGFTPIF